MGLRIPARFVNFIHILKTIVDFNMAICLMGAVCVTGPLSLLPQSVLSRRSFLAIAVSGTAGLLLPSPVVAQSRSSPPSLLRSLPMMGTAVECQAFHGFPQRARRAVEAAFTAVEQVDRDMSLYRPQSDIGRLNRQAGQHGVRVRESTAAVLRESLNIGRASNGALDVTVTPLLAQWGFFSVREEAPNPKQIEAALALVDYRHLHLNDADSTARLSQPGMQLDLGGIAKGYAVDEAAEALERRGVREGMVNAGGDLRLLGRHPDGEPWVVGVQHPLTPSRLLLALSLDEGAVATSGNYLRHRVYDGRRYGHLLHPQNGYPTDTALSMTVVAPTAMRADALATAALVMGRHGLAWLRGQPDAEAVMVTRSPSRPDRLLVQASRGLRDRLTLFDGTAIVEADS